MAQPHMQMVIEGMAMHVPGSPTPSPLVSINLEDAESGLRTNFTAVLHIQGNHYTRTHVGSFEMMLYEFAQMKGESVLDVNLELGWEGQEDSYLRVQALSIEFQSAIKGDYTEYTLKGNGELSCYGNTRSLQIPAINGYYQPSQVLEAVLDYVQADSVFDYDIDHDDEIVPFQRPATITSLSELIFGYGSGTGSIQGLLQQSYCEGSRSSAWGLPKNIPSGMYRQAGFNNAAIMAALGEPVSTTQRSASSYSFSIKEPTFYDRGTIRYKNNANLANYASAEALIYGGLETNILSLTASYNGVSQNIIGSGGSVRTGLAIGLDGTLLTSGSNRQNSYSASAPSMWSAGNAINNLNAVSTQFTTDIQATIVGNTRLYAVGEAVKLIVYSEGTLDPVTGVYRILKVRHSITGTGYTTSLTLKRLDLITANNTVALVSGYTNGCTINGSKIATLSGKKLYLGEPYQNILNLMKRGNP